MKPGIKSTEFWVTAFSILGTVAGGVAGIIGMPAAAVAVAVSGAAYAISRGIAKAKQGDVAGAASEAKTVVNAAKSAKAALKK